MPKAEPREDDNDDDRGILLDQADDEQLVFAEATGRTSGINSKSRRVSKTFLGLIFGMWGPPCFSAVFGVLSLAVVCDGKQTNWLRRPVWATCIGVYLQ